MAITYKVLGQSIPSASTNTDVYTVGAGKSAVVSTINICNQAASSSAATVAVRPSGAALSTSQYIVYQTPVAANDALALTIGVTLAATDVITVSSNTGNVSFSVFGSELS